MHLCICASRRIRNIILPIQTRGDICRSARPRETLVRQSHEGKSTKAIPELFFCYHMLCRMFPNSWGSSIWRPVFHGVVFVEFDNSLVRHLTTLTVFRQLSDMIPVLVTHQVVAWPSVGLFSTPQCGQLVRISAFSRNMMLIYLCTPGFMINFQGRRRSKFC